MHGDPKGNLPQLRLTKSQFSPPGHLCARWWFDWPCPRHHLRSLGCHHCAVPCYRWAGYLPRCRPPGLNLPYHGPQHCWHRALWNCPWCAENPSGLRLNLLKLNFIYLFFLVGLSKPFIRLTCLISFCRTTNPCRISLPFWVWMSCLRRTNWLWPAPARSSVSCPSPSRWLRSSLAIWESWYPSRKPSRASRLSLPVSGLGDWCDLLKYLFIHISRLCPSSYSLVPVPT